MAEIKLIDPFTNIAYAELPIATNENAGATFLSNLRELNIGDGGSNVFRADKQGIWLGGETFATATFSVAMSGAILASDFTLTGGTIRYGKTSFTDAVNAGYFLSALGAYFGGAADITKWKFNIANGSIDYVGAHSGGSIAGIPIAQVGYVATSTADATPSGLAVSSTGISTGSDGSQSAYVVLTWTAVSSNTFSHYVIRYKKGSFTYYTYITSKTNTITIEGLTPNISYDFGISTVNKYGIQSTFGTDIPQTTASDTAAPATVAAGSATGGIQYVIVEWTHSAESDLSYYNIYRNTVDNSATAVKIGSTKTNYFVDGGRTGGQIYYYWVKAVDTSGNESAAFSTVKSATPRNVTSDDIVTIAGTKVLIDGAVYLSNWRHTSDLTKIDGGNIYANSVTLTQLNFTPVQTSNVIASINASAEGISIDADNLTISASTTFAAGYNPTTKVAAVAGTYDSAASGARVRIFPDANTGIQVIDDAGNDAFKVVVGGTNVGDVIIGNYAGGQGIFYDKSGVSTTFQGSILASVMTGGTVQTAASGQRIVLEGAGGALGFPHEILVYASTGTPLEIFGGASYFYVLANLAVRPISFENLSGLASLQILETSVNVVGNITVGGTVDGVDIASHASNASAHHSSVSNALAITPSTVVASGAVSPGEFLKLKNATGAIAADWDGGIPPNGSMYYRTDDHVIRVYLNGTWKTLAVV